MGGNGKGKGKGKKGERQGEGDKVRRGGNLDGRRLAKASPVVTYLLLDHLYAIFISP